MFPIIGIFLHFMSFLCVKNQYVKHIYKGPLQEEPICLKVKSKFMRMNSSCPY